MKLIRYAITAIVLSLLVSCSATNLTFEGYIVEKRDGEVFEILVISNISKDDINDKPKEDLISEAQENQSAYFAIDKDEYNELTVGQKVKVWHERVAAETKPPKVGATKVEILEESEQEKNVDNE
ncbi:DUF3221 domain-containing protein [Cytobacillus sp. IB215665]|uniref:DUF3221 domain-containing protein n=1 Tax=Cytobacillus sp. IB215665 TaxID=3097357 RepID=UPI002A129F1C|nr:DUF3221 domain-containing protein [Cytobacillus sp. IB215665]MDX8365486.1 DUF3221 domain-containing protein [Cytobacillus sp. IB215665]